MDKEKKLSDYIQELSQGLSEGKGFIGDNGVLTPLIKQLIEVSMEGEMDHHLKEEKQRGSSNRRNGRSSKNLKSSLGSIEIFTPRDRESSFEPQLIPKSSRNLPGDLDDKVIALYGMGMSYSDIQQHMADIYGLSVSDGLINSITDRIIPTIREWQSRPLERLYCVIWMDAMYFKVRQDGRVVTKAIYSILGINSHGFKEVLGLYLGDSESASFWLQVLTDLHERGLEDILIASIDNLNGFSKAIESIFPRTEVQLCIVHQIRNTMKYVVWKDYKSVLKDLKLVYKAPSLELAEHNFELFKQKWGKKYPKAIDSWERNWNELTNYFKYPEQIRRLVYTTNTVEGYHRIVRKVTKSKGAFTSENALLKLVYLATINFEKRWQKKILAWNMIFNQLSIYFYDRFSKSDTEF